MIKIKTVGKIEILIAIILFIGAIVGGIWIFNSVSDISNNYSEILRFNQYDLNKYNNETKFVSGLEVISMNLNLTFTAMEIKVIIICSAILLGAISLLMFFDGINKFGFGKKV